MRRYIARRTGQAVLVLWAAYTLSFVLLSALPGDSVRNRIASPESNITPEAARTLLDYYQLDRPIWLQYLHGLGRVFKGEFGYSLTNGSSVGALIADALPSTLRLTGLGLVFGIAFAAAVAGLINYGPNWLRGVASSAPALFASVPTFVVGILALQYLSSGLI